MKSFAMIVGDLRDSDKELVTVVRRAIAHLPDPNPEDFEKDSDIPVRTFIDGKKIGFWTCHGISRWIYNRFLATTGDWLVVDGFYCKTYKHSWLMNRDRKLILDVYPVGGLDATLAVDFTANSPYTERSIAYDSRMLAQFKKESEIIMKKHLESINLKINPI